MSTEYSLCHQSAVYVLREQFRSPEDSLSTRCTVYVLRVQFMSRVQFTSEYSLSKLLHTRQQKPRLYAFMEFMFDLG